MTTLTILLIGLGLVTVGICIGIIIAGLMQANDDIPISPSIRIQEGENIRLIRPRRHGRPRAW